MRINELNKDPENNESVTQNGYQYKQGRVFPFQYVSLHQMGFIKNYNRTQTKKSKKKGTIFKCNESLLTRNYQSPQKRVRPKF